MLLPSTLNGVHLTISVDGGGLISKTRVDEVLAAAASQIPQFTMHSLS